jgi:hypothetical protein
MTKQPVLVEFDLDRYLRNSKKVDLSGVEWERIPDHPLSDGDVMCLHYMMDIEAHTVIYLRDLLATRAAADPQICASRWGRKRARAGPDDARLARHPRLRRDPHDVGSAQAKARMERSRTARRLVRFVLERSGRRSALE